MCCVRLCHRLPATLPHASTLSTTEGRRPRTSADNRVTALAQHAPLPPAALLHGPQDPRLAGKNNMQCKDKFRNLCLTIIQGRPERGLTLSWALKERLRTLIQNERLTF